MTMSDEHGWPGFLGHLTANLEFYIPSPNNRAMELPLHLAVAGVRDEIFFGRYVNRAKNYCRSDFPSRVVSCRAS